MVVMTTQVALVDVKSSLSSVVQVACFPLHSTGRRSLENLGFFLHHRLHGCHDNIGNKIFSKKVDYLNDNLQICFIMWLSCGPHSASGCLSRTGSELENRDEEN